MQPSTGNQTSMLQGPSSGTEIRPCTCRNSRCLKLYCVCFQAGLYCADGVCKCQDCHNNVSTAQAVQVARTVATLRNPSAFKRVMAPTAATPCGSEGVPARGCNCKRSKCLKKYCDCFEAGVHCSPEHCRCMDCLNYAGATIAAGSLSNARSGTGPSTSSAVTPEPGEEEDSHMAAAAYMLQQLHQGAADAQQPAQFGPSPSTIAAHSDQQQQGHSDSGQMNEQHTHPLSSRQPSLERQGSVSRSQGAVSDFVEQPPSGRHMPQQPSSTPAMAQSSVISAPHDDRDAGVVSGGAAHTAPDRNHAAKGNPAGPCSSSSTAPLRHHHPLHHQQQQQHAGRSGTIVRNAIHDGTTAATQRLPHQPPAQLLQPYHQPAVAQQQLPSKAHHPQQPHYPPRHTLETHQSHVQQHGRGQHGASRHMPNIPGQRHSHSVPVPNHQSIHSLPRRHSDPHAPPSVRQTQPVPLPHTHPLRVHHADGSQSHLPPVSSWPGSSSQRPSSRQSSPGPHHTTAIHTFVPHISSSSPPLANPPHQPTDVARDHLPTHSHSVAPPPHHKPIHPGALPGGDHHNYHSHPQSHHAPAHCTHFPDASSRDPHGGDATVTVYRINPTPATASAGGGALVKQPSETLSSTGPHPPNKQLTTAACSSLDAAGLAGGQLEVLARGSLDISMTEPLCGDNVFGCRPNAGTVETAVAPAAKAEHSKPAAVQIEGNMVADSDSQSTTGVLCILPGALARVKQMVFESTAAGGLTSVQAQQALAMGEVGMALAELLAVACERPVTEKEVEVLLALLHMASVETTGVAPLLQWSADRAHDVQYCAEVAACPQLHTACRAIGLQLVACLSVLLPQQYQLNLLHHDAVKRALSVSLSSSEPLSLQLAALAVAAISPAGVMDELDMAFAATAQRLATAGLTTPAAWQGDSTALASLAVPHMAGAPVNPAAKLLLKTSGVSALFVQQPVAAPAAKVPLSSEAVLGEQDPNSIGATEYTHAKILRRAVSDSGHEHLAPGPKSDELAMAAEQRQQQGQMAVGKPAGQQSSEDQRRANSSSDALAGIPADRSTDQELSGNKQAKMAAQSTAQHGMAVRSGQFMSVSLHNALAAPLTSSFVKPQRPQQMPANHMLPLNLGSPRSLSMVRAPGPSLWPAKGSLRWSAAGQLAVSSISPRQQTPGPPDQLAWNWTQHQQQQPQLVHMEQYMRPDGQHLRPASQSLPSHQRILPQHPRPRQLSDTLAGPSHTLDLSMRMLNQAGQCPATDHLLLTTNQHPADSNMVDVPPSTPGAGQVWSLAFPFPSPQHATCSPGDGPGAMMLSGSPANRTCKATSLTDATWDMPARVNLAQYPLRPTSVPPPHPDIRRRLDAGDERLHHSAHQHLQPALSAALPSAPLGSQSQATVPPPCREVAQRMQLAGTPPTTHAQTTKVAVPPDMLPQAQQPLLQRHAEDLPGNADGVVVVHPVPLKYHPHVNPICVASDNTHLSMTSDTQQQQQQVSPQAATNYSALQGVLQAVTTDKCQPMLLQAEMPSVSSPAEPMHSAGHCKDVMVGPASPSHMAAAALLQPDADGRVAVPPANAHAGPAAITGQVAVPPPCTVLPSADSQVAVPPPCSPHGQVTVPPLMSTPRTQHDVHMSVPPMTVSTMPQVPTLAVSPSTPIVAVGPPTTTTVAVKAPFQASPLTIHHTPLISPSAAQGAKLPSTTFESTPIGLETAHSADHPTPFSGMQSQVTLSHLPAGLEQATVRQPSFTSSAAIIAAGTTAQQHQPAVLPAGTWPLDLAERATPMVDVPSSASKPGMSGPSDLPTTQKSVLLDAQNLNPLLDLAEQAAAQAEADAKVTSREVSGSTTAAQNEQRRQRGSGCCGSAQAAPGHSERLVQQPSHLHGLEQRLQQQQQQQHHGLHPHQQVWMAASHGWHMPGSQVMMMPHGLAMFPTPGGPDTTCGGAANKAADAHAPYLMLGPGGMMRLPEPGHPAAMGYPSSGLMQQAQPQMFMGMGSHGMPLMHMHTGGFFPYMGAAAGGGMMPHMNGMMMMPQDASAAWQGGTVPMPARRPVGYEDEGQQQGQQHAGGRNHQICGPVSQDGMGLSHALISQAHVEAHRMVGSKAAPDDAKSAPFKRMRSQAAGDVGGTHLPLVSHSYQK